ncbi:MAG TPA: hypothetical protein ENG83_10675 [Nitrospirae bacterium]|nr:hypothetical protein BMS3Abin06_00241 [bacterium BMS3Abin06]HDH12636.1 hypothetical protein [Nitrospirota bacterium]HDZ02668.1 hypothetical protein [Nitrospirota bacterium]
MDKRLIIIMILILITAFMFGFINSYSTGIQPGYFEKAEAPAYGVGGGELLGAGMSKEFQQYLKGLDIEEDEE